MPFGRKSFTLDVLVIPVVLLERRSVACGKINVFLGSTNFLLPDIKIYFERLLSVVKTGFNVEEISKFPVVRRDLSLVIDKSIIFEQIKAIAEDREFSAVLKDINVFDYYVGEKIEKDKKAYALSFILQDKGKTLTDKVIDKIMNRLMKKYELNLGAVIRK